MAHQVLRHGGERMSGQKVYLALQYLASFVLGIDQGISQSAVGVLLQLPNSRTSETEADRKCREGVAEVDAFSDGIYLYLGFAHLLK
jgi:Zn-dependent protease with chaperone function